MTLRRIALAILVVAAFFIALGFALDFLVDWLWLSTVRYVDVFLTIFAAKAGLFFVVFAALAIVLSLNGALAHRLPRAGKAHGRALPHLPWRFLIAGGALVLASLIALGESGSWDIALCLAGGLCVIAGVSDLIRDLWGACWSGVRPKAEMECFRRGQAGFPRYSAMTRARPWQPLLAPRNGAVSKKFKRTDRRQSFCQPLIPGVVS